MRLRTLKQGPVISPGKRHKQGRFCYSCSVAAPVQTFRVIKALHTLIWAFVAACVLSVPVAAAAGRFSLAGWASSVVLIELLVLALNSGRCPLTDIAARYTSDRLDNFDIYFPLWLARYNKAIFGSLFIVGELYFLACRAGLTG